MEPPWSPRPNSSPNIRTSSRRFVKASLEGWKSYLEGDPAPANKLIKADNPKMSDAQIAFGIKRMNELHIVDGGDAKTMGIGIMTERAGKPTYDLMVSSGPVAEGHRLDTRRSRRNSSKTSRSCGDRLTAPNR